MRPTIILQLVTSCLTLTSMYMAGNGDQRFNFVGLVANVGWHTFTFTQGAWGLLPLNCALLLIYCRNIKKNYFKSDHRMREGSDGSC